MSVFPRLMEVGYVPWAFVHYYIWNGVSAVIVGKAIDRFSMKACLGLHFGTLCKSQVEK